MAAQTPTITPRATLAIHQEATEEAPPRNLEVLVAIQTPTTTLQETRATPQEVMVAAQTQMIILQAIRALHQEDMAEAVILMDQATPETHPGVLDKPLTTQTPTAALATLATKVTAPLGSCLRRLVTCSRTTTWFRRDRPSALRLEMMITPVETLAVATTAAETIMITTRWATSGNDCTMRWIFFLGRQ